MAWSTIASFMTGVSTVATSVVGYLNTIPTAVYKTIQDTRTNGQSGPLTAGQHGELIVMTTFEDASNHVAIVVRKPMSSQTYAWNHDNSIAYEASTVTSAVPCTIRRIAGFNSGASGQFIQLHNAISLPAEGQVPDDIVWAASQSNFEIDYGEDGYYCSIGAVICNSLTGPTKTIGANDCWLRIDYI